MQFSKKLLSGFSSTTKGGFTQRSTTWIVILAYEMRACCSRKENST